MQASNANKTTWRINLHFIVREKTVAFRPAHSLPRQYLPARIVSDGVAPFLPGSRGPLLVKNPDNLLPAEGKKKIHSPLLLDNWRQPINLYG
ncbi:MAG: hypothetical protein H7Z75_17570 [Ferruginibacter sp.]|nr:hypothetical protein [Cytophagales bacterium]